MLHRVVAVLLLTAAGWALPTSAHAAACSGTSGVTVIVDFDNGTIVERCAPGDPSSGFDALIKAGFTLTYASGNGNGALCSIDRVPDHVCTSMPPASAYWAYFHGKSDGSWSYSTYGGGSYNPKPGSVEGWRFRGSPSKPPGVQAPVTTVKPSPTPTRSSTAGPTARPTATIPGSAAPGSTSGSVSDRTQAAPDASSSPAAGKSPTARSSAEAPGGADGADGAATDPAAPPDAADAASRTASGRSDDSGGASWIWGLVLIAVLGGSAGAVAVRRRKA